MKPLDNHYPPASAPETYYDLMVHAAKQTIGSAAKQQVLDSWNFEVEVQRAREEHLKEFRQSIAPQREAWSIELTNAARLEVSQEVAIWRTKFMTDSLAQARSESEAWVNQQILLTNPETTPRRPKKVARRLSPVSPTRSMHTPRMHTSPNCRGRPQSPTNPFIGQDPANRPPSPIRTHQDEITGAMQSKWEAMHALKLKDPAYHGTMASMHAVEVEMTSPEVALSLLPYTTLDLSPSLNHCLLPSLAPDP
ncbi:hypothetical protein B0F90DRAFT_1827712 [Multifurca ochricompacta]|uniref:Uncharacterized protein n=1 Tax=Multifurca ochricompacta TaxID=376703 RepID=A0AAD4LTX1_9AGAM|nr:hypothetical protein B0F90DRAFT_1827712 [Multifurca ochricompacta]